VVLVLPHILPVVIGSNITARLGRSEVEGKYYLLQHFELIASTRNLINFHILCAIDKPISIRYSIVIKSESGHFFYDHRLIAWNSDRGIKVSLWIIFA